MGARMNAASLTLALALFAGVLMAVQAPTNALLGKASGSPVVAAFISFVVGTVALGALVAASSGRLFAPELKSVPWYAWLGGLYGAFFVAIAAFGAPKVGIGPLLTAAIGGQLIGAVDPRSLRAARARASAGQHREDRRCPARPHRRVARAEGLMGYLIVFAGAGFGGALRHGVNLAAARIFGFGFPFGTIIVNVLGSFLMGFLAGYFAYRTGLPQHLRLFLTTGMLGGFTTFSAFSLDAALLLERHAYWPAAAYVLGSVILSLAGLFVGLGLFRTGAILP